jgi:DnaJ family protein C protein 10
MIILKIIVIICGIFLFNAEQQQQDLYKLLGISKTATTREIRQAFKKIALEKHPDKNTVTFYLYIFTFFFYTQ